MTTPTLRAWGVSSNLLVVILLLLTFTLKAQQNSASNGFTLQFVKEESNGSVSEVASNVLKVRNNSGRRYVFKLELGSPQGIYWMNYHKGMCCYYKKEYESAKKYLGLISISNAPLSIIIKSYLKIRLMNLMNV